MLRALRGLWLLVGISFSHFIPQTFADMCTGQGVSVLSCWLEEAGLEGDGRVRPGALEHIHSRHIR